ncbi:MAG: ATP-dependent DNA helicase, partial [Candidatus Omnitrophota bacterium]
NVEVGTFHSFSRNYIIIESEEAANYIQERIQITDIEKLKAIEHILDTSPGVEAIRPFNAPYIHRNAIERKISELKNEGITPGEFSAFTAGLEPDGVYIEDKHLPRLRALAVVYERYETLKKGLDKNIFDERGRYDYDDMILIALEAIKKEPELADRLRRQYRYIMVDEFQDTNGAQLELLFSLVDEKQPNLCCVGDDDQSIYRFQGASTANFRIFMDRFPGIRTIKLKSNYRSTEEIVALSDKIISQVPGQERVENKKQVSLADYAKKDIRAFEFTTKHEELAFIINTIKDLKEAIRKSGGLTKEERQSPYNNIAILVRKRSYIPRLIEAFLKAGIPYCTDGKEDISGEKRVRQLLDALELACVDPGDTRGRDISLYKVLASDYFSIPHADILTFIGFVNKKRLAEREGRSPSDTCLLAEFLNCFPADSGTRPGRKETACLPIIKLLPLKSPERLHRASWAITRLLDDARNKTVHSTVMQFIDDAGIYRYMLSGHESGVLRMRELRALTSFINTVKTTDLARPGIGLDEFTDEMNARKMHGIPLQGELTTTTQDGVRIYTAHGSKGLEFHSVIIPFCLQDKNWPLKPSGDSIPLPPEIYKNKERAREKEQIKRLISYDETRLFYVAASRAKANLIFTASPSEDDISSIYFNSAGIKPEKYKFEESDLLLRELQRSPGGDTLAGTERILKGLISDLVLTPTKLNNFILCKRKFLYDSVLQLPGRKKQSLIFGNCVHKALELTYGEFRETRVFPGFSFFKDSFMRELRFQGADRGIERGCADKLPMLKKWFAKEEKNPSVPIGLEKKIIINIDGIPFTGKYDKIEMDDEKSRSIRVIDYKTGKPDRHLKALSGPADLSSDECDNYLRQLVAYKLLFERDKYYDKKLSMDYGMLVFIEPVAATVRKYNLEKGAFCNKKVPLTPEMVSRLEAVIKDVWRRIQILDFGKLPERDSDKCRHCDFDSICWV